MKFTFDELVKQEVINLDQKKLDDDDFEAIKNVLQASKHAAVKELRLSGTNNITLADGKFTNALANNNTLGTLSISHNNIGVEGQSIWQLHLQRIRLSQGTTSIAKQNSCRRGEVFGRSTKTEQQA